MIMADYLLQKAKKDAVHAPFLLNDRKQIVRSMIERKGMEFGTLAGSDQPTTTRNPSYSLYGPENAKIQDHSIP